MKHEIKTTWIEGMKLESSLNGHTINLDSSEEFGGSDSGVRSKPLMLLSLAGCTSMDVLSILKKMHIELQGFTVDVIAELGDEHPMMYETTHVTYNFQGNDLNKEKIERAVELSFNTYCGVIAMFKQFATVTKEIRYV